MTKEINEENIRVAAYYIWEQAGRPEGKDKECWIKACEQLFAPKKVKVSVKKPASKKVAAPKAPAKKVAPKAVKPAAKPVAPKAPAKKAAPKAVKPAAKPVAKAPVKKAKAAPFYGSRK